MTLHSLLYQSNAVIFDPQVIFDQFDHPSGKCRRVELVIEFFKNFCSLPFLDDKGTIPERANCGSRKMTNLQHLEHEGICLENSFFVSLSFSF